MSELRVIGPCIHDHQFISQAYLPSIRRVIGFTFDQLIDRCSPALTAWQLLRLPPYVGWSALLRNPSVLVLANDPLALLRPAIQGRVLPTEAGNADESCSRVLVHLCTVFRAGTSTGL